MLDFNLSEEQRLLQQTARDFAINELSAGFVREISDNVCSRS